jgi:hypothetical protein
VRLAGLAGNCRVQGDNPRAVTVAAGATAEVSFTIVCSATTGSIRVSVATSGSPIDPDGYTIKLDNRDPGQPVAVNGSATLSGVSAGRHSVALSGVASNCSVGDGASREVNVTVGGTAEVAFAVTCSAGPDPDQVARWSSMESGTTSTLLDVWATRSGDPLAGFVVNAVPGEIFSLGENGWSRETLAQPWSLNGVWGRSAQDVFAVGEIETERPPDAEFAFRAVVLRRQAGAWLEMPGLTPPAGSEGTPWSLNDAWGFGNDLFAVGTFYSSREGEIVGGFVAQHNGTTWTTTRLLPNEGVGLESVSGVSASDVYAVGGAFGAGSDLPGPGVVFHYNGTTWAEVQRKERSLLSGVWAASSNSVFVVGADYSNYYQDWVVTGFVLYYDGRSWSEIFREKGLYLTQLWGASPTDVYAVGSDGTILHYDGARWTRQDTPTDRALHGIWGRSPSDIYAIGESGTILHGTP